MDAVQQNTGTPAEARSAEGRSEAGAPERGALEPVGAGGEAAGLDPVEKFYAAGDQEPPRLGAVLDQLGIGAPCERPLMVVDETTGRTATVRCGTRRQAVCASCAALYRGDAGAILRSGTLDCPGFVVVMLTLTAPSFGPVHRVPKSASPRLPADARASWERRARSRCRCGEQHCPADPLAGVAIDSSRYDFRGQARWNAWTGRLWNRTATLLTRRLGLADRLQYAGVAEPQARGAMHFHMLLRIPAGNALDVYSDRLGRRRSRLIEHAVGSVSTSADGELIRWGQQVVAEIVHVPGGSGRLGARTIGYLTKVLNYTSKDLGASGRGSRAHLARCASAARALPCDCCESGRYVGCGSRCHRELGYSGHPLRKSRDFGLTFRELRARRRRWREARSAEQCEPGLVATQPVWHMVGYVLLDPRRSLFDRLRATLS